MGNFKEALADFDAVVNDPNATEKVFEYLKFIFEENFRKFR